MTNKSGTLMMDSDLAMTCSLPSPLVGHQLAHLSINWPHDFHGPQIMYHLSSQLIQTLQLSFIYHNNLSPSPSLSLFLLTLRKLAFPSSILDHFFSVIGKLLSLPPPISPSHFSLSFVDFPSLAPSLPWI